MADNQHSHAVFDLSQYILNKAPQAVYYIPNYITEDEEAYLVKKVYEAPKPKWTNLSNRRLQNWGGVPHEKGMIADEIPKWLLTVCERVGTLGAFESCKANHILVNEYLPSQGIMPHTDGPMYYPSVANITLNSHGVLDLYHPINKEQTYHSVPETYRSKDSQVSHSTSLDDRHLGSILLERRSLLLVQKDMYSDYLHGIRELNSDVINKTFVNLDFCPGIKLGDDLKRGTRVSLTIRHVPKVLKTRFLFGKKR